MTSRSGDARGRRPLAIPAIALVTAIGLGITAILGGFGEAAGRPPRQLGPGASLDQGAFTTRFVESRAVVRPDDGGVVRPFLEVELQVVNQGGATTGVGVPRRGKTPGLLFAASLLSMTPAVETGAGPIVSVPGRGVPSGQLHPDLPATVVLRYELPAGRHVPGQVRFDVGAFERAGETLTGAEPEWSLIRDGRADDAPPTVVAQVTLPVRWVGRV